MANTAQYIPTQQIRSNTPGSVPDSSALREGQLAINLPDRLLYTKQSNGNVVPLTQKGEKGDTGVKGDKGNNGFAPFDATIDSSPDGLSRIFTFTYPDGSTIDIAVPVSDIKGDKGDIGEKGDASTVAGPKGDDGSAGEKGNLGQKGDIGPTGNKGEAGLSGVSLPYKFSTDITVGDPGTGFIRFNSNTFANATQLVIHDRDSSNVNVSALIETLDDSTSPFKGFLRVYDLSSPEQFAIFKIVGDRADNLLFSVFNVEHVVSTVSSFNNTLPVAVNFDLIGDKGQKGEQGIAGAAGQKGADGVIGVDGEKGQKGDKGIDGIIGVDGEKGQKGESISNTQYVSANDTLLIYLTDNTVTTVNGLRGSKGDTGETGQKGERINNVVYYQANDTLRFVSSDLAPYEISGIRGPKGDSGQKGVDGLAIKGDKGEVGPKGEIGSVGAKGDTGATGVKGDAGVLGTKGDKGDTGNKGDIGVQGPSGNFGGATFDYTFNNQLTATDPGIGKLSLNNALVASATRMYIDDADDAGTDIQSFLRTIDDSTSAIKGHFRISRKNDAGVYALFAINDLVLENVGFFNVSCAYITGSTTSFQDGEDVIITFARTGDIGDKGPQGEKGETGNQGQKGERIISAVYDDDTNRIVFTNSGTPSSTFDVFGVKGQKGVQLSLIHI